MSKKCPDDAAATGQTAEITRRQAVTVMAPMLMLAQPAAADDSILQLIKLSQDGNAALMRGDIETYRALVPYSSDFTLMSPFGGTPSHGSQYTPEQWERIGQFFRNGTFKQEIVQTYGSADMVVLATIERPHVEVAGLPAQEWALRVTLVYRRAGSDWHLVHRHADPLANGISHQQAAALARGLAPGN
jgi:ketosteroid isomerase-like protein